MSEILLQRSLSKGSDSSTWVSQSKGFWLEYDSPLFYIFIYLVIAFSGAILIHSSIMHKKVFKAVRIAIDTSAVCGILIGIIILIAYDRPNPTKTAIMRDLFAFGFLQAIVQYCDAYMFFKVCQLYSI
jgi:nitrate reductase gamma subunit